MKIVYAFTVLANCDEACFEAHAYETCATFDTGRLCDGWSGLARRCECCNSTLEVSNSTPAEERVDGITQPLTRTACDKAGLAWNESANVCGSQAHDLGS